MLRKKTIGIGTKSPFVKPDTNDKEEEEDKDEWF